MIPLQPSQFDGAGRSFVDPLFVTGRGAVFEDSRTASTRAANTLPRTMLDGSTRSGLWTGCRSVGLGVCVALHLAAQKAPDVRVDRGPAGAANSQAAQIAAAGASVYVTWLDYRNGLGDIYFSRSLDGGATWLPADRRLDTDPPGGALSLEPQIAASDSAVFVTWADLRTSVAQVYAADVYFNRSLDRGATWLASDVRLDTDPAGKASSGAPRIAASGSSVYVTWVDDRDGTPDVYFNRSLDSGTTWPNTDARINGGPAGVTQSIGPQIVAAGSSVYVVWYEDRNVLFVPGARFDIRFTRSLDGGLTWLVPDLQLDRDPPGATNSFSPAIAADGSSVYVVWADERNGSSIVHDIYFNRSLDNGSTWLPQDVRLDTDPAGSAQSEHQQIAASGSSVYAVWCDHRNGAADIYFNRSLDGGASWLPQDVRLNTDPAGSSPSWHPRIAAFGQQVSVTWYDLRNPGLTSGDVYFNRSTDGGTTWLASDVRLDNGDPPGAANSWAPAIAAAGPAVYVAWEDSRNSTTGGSDIYFNLPFGAQAYGRGTRGAGGIVPTLVVSGSATLGSTVSADVSNGLGFTAGAVLLGAGPGSKVTTPFVGGTLLVQPALVVPIRLGGSAFPGGGFGSLPLPIPSGLSAFGVNVNCQAVFLDPGAANLVSMTNGIELWIG